MKKLVTLLLTCLFVFCLFSVDIHSYVGARVEYGISDIKATERTADVNVDGKFVFKADGKSTLRPYGGFGLGFLFDPSKEDLDFSANGLFVNANGGIQYRFWRNVYGFGGLDLEGDLNTNSKEEKDFTFRSVALDFGAGIANGSFGAELGLRAGYNVSQEKAFMFKPYAKILVGLGGNKVFKYDESGEAIVDSEVSDNLTVRSIGVDLAFMPGGEKVSSGKQFAVNYSSDFYFRFKDPEKKVAPFAGFTGKIGYGDLAFVIAAQAYGGVGYKTSDNIILNISTGTQMGVGFLKGFSDASEDGKVLLLAFGWILPSGYEMDFFVSPSVTYLNDNDFGFKVGCDLGYMMWSNAFAWTGSKRTVVGGGTGLFARPYVNVSFGH